MPLGLVLDRKLLLENPFIDPPSLLWGLVSWNGRAIRQPAAERSRSLGGCKMQH
jgi:hypothetical protein